MKKIIPCLIVALSLFAVTGFSQQGGGGDRAAKMKQMLKDSLQLTDVQVDSVAAVDKDFRPQTMQIMMDQSLSPDDKKTKWQALNDQKKARLAGFLSADQIAKLEAMEMNMRAKMRQRQGGGGQR